MAGADGCLAGVAVARGWERAGVAVAGATWLPVPGVENHRVTVDASSGARFYRLRQ